SLPISRHLAGKLVDHPTRPGKPHPPGRPPSHQLVEEHLVQHRPRPSARILLSNTGGAPRIGIVGHAHGCSLPITAHQPLTRITPPPSQKIFAPPRRSAGTGFRQRGVTVGHEDLPASA